MEETQNATDKQRLTKEERSKIAKDAAKRRWAKAARATKAKASKRSKHKAGSNAGTRREFSTALKAAEKQLAKCIHDRDEAGARYAVADGQIPSLMNVIRALRNPAGAVGRSEYAASLPQSIEQIISDPPLGFVNAKVPAIPVPSPVHPANQTANRAQGGAIGVELDVEEDENKFLRESPVSGGEWR